MNRDLTRSGGANSATVYFFSDGPESAAQGWRMEASTADVLTSKGVTSVTVAEGAGNATTALAIARMVMNR